MATILGVAFFGAATPVVALFVFYQYGEKMNNYTHKTNQNIAKRTEALKNKATDERELFKKALYEAIELKICEIEEKSQSPNLDKK